MRNKCEPEVKMDSNDLEEPYRPFSQLPPEVVDQILRNLSHLPSRIAASGVCRLWRGLLDWNWTDFEHLQLDFGQLSIDEIARPLAKWSRALTSLLPKVQITSISNTLPSDAKVSPGLSLSWPLGLLDCGMALPGLQPYLTSVSIANINGVASPGFGFMCHLLELCPSLSEVHLSLTDDRFDLPSLQWALSDKSIQSLSINIAHLTGHCDTEGLAKLCRAVNPETLQSLAIVTGEEDAADHPHVFCFDHWCTELWDSDHRLDSLEHLKITAPRLVLSAGYNYQFSHDPDAPNFPNILWYALPEIQTVEFTFAQLQSAMFTKLLGPFNLLSSFSRIDISLLTSHCSLLELYVGCDDLYRTYRGRPFDAQITPKGFLRCDLQFPCPQAQMQFVCERLAEQCKCEICCSESNWIKLELTRLLKLITQDDTPQQFVPQDVCLYSCQINQLKAELVSVFPDLSVSKVNAFNRIRVKGKELYVRRMRHDQFMLGPHGNSCPGCMMSVAP